jgi:hypothetical protein
MEYGEESVGKKREFPVKVVKKIYVLKENFFKKKYGKEVLLLLKKKTKIIYMYTNNFFI